MKKILFTFGVLTLFLTQCSLPKLSGQIIYNEGDYARKPVLLDLADMNKHNIVLPDSHQVSIVGSSRGGIMDIRSLTLDRFAWSHSGDYVAFPCLPKGSLYLTICVWDSAFITLENRTASQIPQSYPLDPPQYSTYYGSSIESISWSPDDQTIIATSRVQVDDISPCLIYLASGQVECGPNSPFWEGFSNDDRQILSGAYQISWSPTDKDMLAISLRKNWLTVFDDGKMTKAVFDGVNIVGYEEVERYTNFPTGDYLEGLYLVDKNNKFLKNIWNAPDNLKIDIENKLLWTPNGRDLTFVCADIDTFDRVNRTANFLVMNVGVHTNKEKVLFDGGEVMKEILEDLPESYRAGLPEIFLGTWSSEGRYLLFEIGLLEDSNNPDADGWTDYLKGAFVYDTRTKSFYKVIDYILGRGRLNPDWKN
jgi:hypothetical protein